MPYFITKETLKTDGSATAFSEADIIEMTFDISKLPLSNQSHGGIEAFIINRLEEQLCLFEKEFFDYLATLETNIRKTNYESNNNIQFQAEKVLNFNYTDTCQYISKNIQYVHGSVKENNIVFGIDDTMSPKIKELAGIYEYYPFFKRARRILKNCNPNYSLFINSIKDESKVAVFGHSLDKADYSILKPIFDKPLHFDLYYYCGNSQEQKEKENVTKERLIDLLGIDRVESLYNDDRLSFISID